MQSKAETEISTLFDDFTRDEKWISEIQTISKSISTKTAQQSSTKEKEKKEGEMTKLLCQIMDEFDGT
jgi:hypothetical protein